MITPDLNEAPQGLDAAALDAGVACGAQIHTGAVRLQSYTITQAEVRGRGGARGRTGGTDPDGSGDTGAGGLGFDQPWSFDLQGRSGGGSHSDGTSCTGS